MVEEPNYYSIEFHYQHAVRGVSGGGVHISFGVDEHKESRRLWAANETVCKVLDDIDIQHRHEYMWPDGSLYRFVRTTYDIINLSLLLTAKLGGMTFKIRPLEPAYKARWGQEESIEDFFKNTLSDKGHRRRGLIEFVAHAVVPQMKQQTPIGEQ